jgi:WD40 repeat protein
MTPKQLQQLFMKIDANSDGHVGNIISKLSKLFHILDWNEFMNYMLLENESLFTMKVDHFEYVIKNPPDPSGSKWQLCHRDMITCVLVAEINDERKSYRYFSGSRDGDVKIWQPPHMTLLHSINVTKSWVTCLQYMYHSDYLVVGAADRTVSFYDLSQSNTSINVPVSKVSDYEGVPLCIDYHYFKDLKKELLFVGDDLGIVHVYICELGWHICNYYVRNDVR